MRGQPIPKISPNRRGLAWITTYLTSREAHRSTGRFR
nr:MAG TPA: hypothetical protein [Caudoviricetes sp.]